MLEFLVTSRTRRRLVELLWSGGAGSTAELARRVGCNYATVHRELAAMEQLGLVTSQGDKGKRHYLARKEHPGYPLLEKLVESSRGPRPRADLSGADQDVRVRLRDAGAPLAVEGEAKAVSLTQTIVDGAALAPRDPSVARTLPVLLWRNRTKLDWDELAAEARTRGERQRLGFFLDLTAELSGSQQFKDWSRQLQDHRVKLERDFFRSDGTSPRARALAERRTPAVARRWHYRMNMDLDAFASHFRKFTAHELQRD